MTEAHGTDRYRSMRDFDATPEPRGGQPEEAPGGNRFVIQQHDATRLHWDLRLEHEGVLLSWALPRGLPWTPDENHLAVHTEDHPLEYLEFEGRIPDGNYGAGAMTIWDQGTYEPEKIEDGKLVVVLRGERAQGRYALFRTRGRDWMIHRMDPPADPGRRPVPAGLRPMLASPGTLPTGDERWAFEVLWSGARVLVTSSGGVVTIAGADGADVSASFPEVRRIGRALGMTEVILDGVIGTGEPGAGAAVERRLAARSESTVRRLSRDHPLALVAFDVLWLDGYSQLAEPWERRRDRLDSLGLDGPAWKAPAAHIGDGPALLEAATERGLPGLVAKRTDSRYEPGVRSSTWLEITTPGR